MRFSVDYDGDTQTNILSLLHTFDKLHFFIYDSHFFAHNGDNGGLNRNWVIDVDTEAYMLFRC